MKFQERNQEEEVEGAQSPEDCSALRPSENSRARRPSSSASGQDEEFRKKKKEKCTRHIHLRLHIRLARTSFVPLHHQDCRNEKRRLENVTVGGEVLTCVCDRWRRGPYLLFTRVNSAG